MTDAPEESQEPGAPKEPQYKEVSDELKRVLAEHAKWVQTAGKEGAQASLAGAKLQKANLGSANLQGANLLGANLQEADLSGANLTEAKELTQLQLDQACGDEETKLPEGLTIETCPEEQEGSTDG